MNGWLALCLSWQLGQPPQMHLAAGRYNSPVRVLGVPLAPVSFHRSLMAAKDTPAAGPMAAFLQQCR